MIQVHDELLVECNDKIVSLTKKQIANEMENATDPLVKFSIPLTVDVKSGNNWNEAH